MSAFCNPVSRSGTSRPIHWIVYWPGVAVALLAVAAFWFSEKRLLTGVWLYTGYALVLGAVVLLVQEWFQSWITEIAVTNRRVIYKKGLIRFQTNEMNTDKVESVQVDQSFLGRMFDYGGVNPERHRRRLRDLRTIASRSVRNGVTAFGSEPLSPPQRPETQPQRRADSSSLTRRMTANFETDTRARAN